MRERVEFHPSSEVISLLLLYTVPTRTDWKFSSFLVLGLYEIYGRTTFLWLIKKDFCHLLYYLLFYCIFHWCIFFYNNETNICLYILYDKKCFDRKKTRLKINFKIALFLKIQDKANNFVIYFFLNFKKSLSFLHFLIWIRLNIAYK